MTDTEKQEIISEVLAQLRADSKDFSGSQIAIKSAFEDAYEERSKIKLPAFDERTNSGADATAGTISLEALLTAYGLTRVEEIASEVSNAYMKKTADSDLNMNGKNVTNVKIHNSYTPLGYTAPYAELPQLSYATLGLADNPSFEDFMTAWTLKVVEIYGTPISVRGKVLVDSRTGYGDIWGWVSSGTDSNGATSFCCIYQDCYPARTIFTYRKNASDSIHVEQFSTFPYGDTTRDNRINSMGTNYIRYENGLQICWGVKRYTTPASTPGGVLYFSDGNPNILFTQGFVSTPSVSIQIGEITSLTIASLNLLTTGINFVRLLCPFTFSATELVLSYIAVGKWK